MPDVVQESHHALDVVEERQMERLQLDGDLQAQLAGVLAHFAHRLHGPVPLVARRDHFLLPDVLADHDEVVLRLQFVAELQVLLRAVDVEAADAGVEVDEAERAADHGDHRQARSRALSLMSLRSLASISSGSAEDVDRVEADLLVSRMPSAVPPASRTTPS